jgi:hypothetical protein
VALPPYYQRAAVAMSQVLHGYDDEAIRRKLQDTAIGISFGPQASNSPDGRALLDLLIRLLARLYPRLFLCGHNADAQATSLYHLAQSINPDIEMVTEQDATLSIVVGDDVVAPPSPFIAAGCRGWRGMVGTDLLPVADSGNPFGAGIAAALAAANVFRHVFISADLLDRAAVLTAIPDGGNLPTPSKVDLGSANVVCGLGAIGQAVVWALARVPASGDLDVVDHESVELDNMQRYILTAVPDEGHVKTTLAARHLGERLRVRKHAMPWSEFVAREGYAWNRVVCGVDSAAVRRQVQASLPRWICNAWTQPGDLGISRHAFGRGACMACLYMPRTPTSNEDAIIATALGIPEVPLLMRVRELLYWNAGAPDDLLAVIADRRPDVDRTALMKFSGRPLRELYREGFCGGAVLPIGQAGRPQADVHVPIAHQSALAGVLAAAALVADTLGFRSVRSDSLRVDVLRPLPYGIRFQPIGAESGCLCQDRDYQRRYAAKWPHPLSCVSEYPAQAAC